MLGDLDEEAIEFETLLADKRHRDLVKLLTKILAATEANKTTTSLFDNQIKEFVNAIHSLPAPVANVELEVNQEKVVLSINELAENILKELGSLKAQMEVKHEWEFSVIRGTYGGLIEKVKAKQIK